jgi:hypothetical protein
MSVLWLAPLAVRAEAPLRPSSASNTLRAAAARNATLTSPKPAPVAASPAQPALSSQAKYPVTGRGGTQTIYVRATDAAGQGVAKLPVKVVVREGKTTRRIAAAPTDAQGYSSCSFPIGDAQMGQTVVVETIAQWQGAEVKDCTTYLPWW